ncbi:MAG: hypothetical protein V1701_01400 [Planctomycetota bacterium]
MAENTAQAKKYHIIISTIDEKWVGGIPDMAKHLASTFGMNEEAAEQVLGGTPIAFITNINKDVTKMLKPKLIELSKKGIEFMVSSKLPPTIARVIWPSRFNFQELPNGQIVQYADFQWRGNAFVCPNCGETFVFKRIGNPFNTFMKAQESTMPESSEGRVVEVQPIDGETVELPAIEERELKAEPVVEKVSTEEESPEIELSAEEFPAQEKVAEVKPIAKRVSTEDGVVELEPVVEETSTESGAEPVDILHEPLQSAATPKPKIVSKSMPKEVAMEADSTDVNEYSLFLSAIPQAKREEAAELIAEIKGVQIAQARQMANRMMIPILKDVSETVAKECLARFKQAGLNGQMIKKKS